MNDLKRIKTLAEAALSSMRERLVPPTPENFQVWFHYHADSYGDLTRLIDGLLRDKAAFDQRRNDELYARFFGGEIQNATLNAAASTEKILQEVLSQIGLANQDAASYAGFLRETASKLEGGVSAQTLPALLSGLFAETKRIQERNEALESRLLNSSEEMSILRRDLETMQRDAQTDGLTGIANRKRFDMEMRRVLREAEETGQPMCLIMLDIDHFKKFNDLYGHQMGDQVLKLVARTMKDCVRAGDLPARFGGEEFSVVLPNAGLAEAADIADRIRRTIASRRIVRRDSKVELGGITLCAGVALWQMGESVSGLIERADEALYVAKRSGRNRVITEEQVRDPDAIKM
ncbi:GGDEF domain-containing protein [Oceanibaculum pacificum]|uniref:diguanylate cyclase n=1 Tax=Oceanibaculum pacificum TaxID=580166 RepID=A0A154WF79_9PROT|nr:GGDEF domain-containing protein [Oceanibaculum pacificum]KZD12170.1 hypothetical protein AUP43_17170 [Oceanibaculum pacificum]